MRKINTMSLLLVGLQVGFLLNLFGWLANNILLGSMWQQVGESLSDSAWRGSVWRDVFSLLPDFGYGFAIVWLWVKLRSSYESSLTTSFVTGLFVSLVGGITTYFAIANSGFIPWKLALLSFGLVAATKIPLAILGGYQLEKKLIDAQANS